MSTSVPANEPLPESDGTFSRRVLRSFAWQGGAQIAAQAISWGATLFVIRLLSPADYGLMAMVILFMEFLFVIAEMGVGGAIIQAKTMDAVTARRMFGLTLIMNGLGALVCLLSAPLVASFFGEPRLVLLARVLSINFLLTALMSLPLADAIRRLDFSMKGKIDVVATLAGALTTLSFAAGGYGVWALVFGMLALNATKVVAYQIASPVWVLPLFNIRAVAPLARFGYLLSLTRIAFYFQGNIAAWIIGRALGKEALGLYTVALTFAAAPLQRVIPVLTQVSFSAFSRIQTDRERIRRNVLRAVRFGSLIAFPVLFGLAAVAPIAVPLILGPKWNPAIVLVQVLSVVVPLRILSSLLSPALLGTGHAGASLTNVLIACAVLTCGFLVGVQFGVMGAAVSWAVLYPVVFFITTARTTRILAVPLKSVAKEILPYMAIAAVMAGLVTITRRVFTEAMPGWATLSGLVALGIVCYAGLVFVKDRPTASDVRNLLS